MEINADSDDYRALESDLELSSDSSSETAPNKPPAATKVIYTIKSAAVQPKATTEVPNSLTQTNATASRNPPLVSTTETIKSSGIGNKPIESTASELQALQALDSTNTPESTVTQPIPTKKVPIPPNQTTANQKSQTVSTTAAVRTNDIGNKPTKTVIELLESDAEQIGRAHV